MSNFDYIMYAIEFGLVAVIFFVLFIVFLIKSIERGRKIKELEKKLKETQLPLYPGMPVYYPVKDANNPQGVMAGQMPVPQPVQAAVPVSAPVQNAVPVSAPVQNAVPVSAPVQAAVPTAAPLSAPVQTAVPVSANVQTASQTSAPVQGSVPTPSWAVPQAQVQAARQPIPEPVQAKPQREKFFSSINITFGIGVLLLTIVGATFMTGSWPWMTEAIRAVCLVAIVVIVYAMSFFAGKVLKLQQTGFALYSLASLLGPIVIVGMGAFELLGPGFSFKDGSGWLVASVAALTLLVSSIGGRFLFKERVQANIYEFTSYLSLTWLVVFISGMIGQESEGVNEFSMVCLGLATLALVFRILGMTKLFEGETFFRVYSEIITYIPAGLLFLAVWDSDGAVFGATIVEFITFVILARFTEGRAWVRYLTPLAGMMVAISWCVFEDSNEMYLMTSILIAIIVLLFVLHKVFSISSAMSDYGFPVALGVMTMFVAVEEVPEMGAVACFISLALFVYQMVFEPLIAKSNAFPEGVFKESRYLAEKVLMSVLSAAFYYSGVVMVFLKLENPPFGGHLYFTLTALVPAVIAIVFRIVCKDDIRVTVSGLVLSVISVFAGFLSCFNTRVHGVDGTYMYYRDDICAWLLMLSIMALSVFFMIKPLKEKRLSTGVMFWAVLCLNSIASGVFVFIEYLEGYQQTIDYVSDVSFPLMKQNASIAFLALNVAALAVSFFVRRKGTGLAAKYAEGIRYFLCGAALSWFSLVWILVDAGWELLIVAVIFAVLLTFMDLEFFSILPVFAAEISILYELSRLDSSDLSNILCIVAAIAVAGLGRLLFRKAVFSKKAIDYLSLTSFVFLFGLDGSDYSAMMVFLALALIVMNLAGRVKISVRILLSVFASLVCMALIAQPFITIPDVIDLEVDLMLILGTLLIICKVIRPAAANVMKYFWFTGVALSLIAEGISAAVTSEVLDLIVVGTASFGIFIYAFIRRNRLWFILGIVAMVSVAVYLSVAFWSSLVWLIYLFVAGSILIVMASINEWGKRHNKDGKKKRFFEEWTW